MMKSRRAVLKSMFAAVLATGAAALDTARARSIVEQPLKRPSPEPRADKPFSGGMTDGIRRQPLISQFAVHEGFVFVKGMGEHDEPDIRKATTAVLDKIEEQLLEAGSSMDKALKVTVFLRNLRDYDAMNDAYRGRFGDQPPVRTTVACYNGIPGNSLLEIDCIAAL